MVVDRPTVLPLRPERAQAEPAPGSGARGLGHDDFVIKLPNSECVLQGQTRYGDDPTDARLAASNEDLIESGE